ncbi:hypothetical protein, partial [Staphylococcus aureus]|uniref:hypothetical protein n=4 Tax=Staphylococcus aureus TaxID=1280 RepID=UPI001B30FF09
EADEKSAYNNVQVGDGPQHSEIGFPISTDNASWRAPTQKLAESQLTIMCKLGLDDEINFAKISFLSHLTQNKFHYPQNKQLTI